MDCLEKKRRSPRCFDHQTLRRLTRGHELLQPDLELHLQAARSTIAMAQLEASPPMIHGFGYEKHWKSIDLLWPFLIPVGFCNKKTWAAGLSLPLVAGAELCTRQLTANDGSKRCRRFSSFSAPRRFSVFLTELKGDSHNFGGWCTLCLCVFYSKNNCWKLW